MTAFSSLRSSARFSAALPIAFRPALNALLAARRRRTAKSIRCLVNVLPGRRLLSLGCRGNRPADFLLRSQAEAARPDLIDGDDLVLRFLIQVSPCVGEFR